ncbi:MAG: hypothetical protein LN590_07670 [Rickettsia endosymbiont of Glossina mortisans submortisans]|nr:hypothetical protein [Rickettsia endosymbiont of Glossina mortisans submortisans]
MAQFSRHCEKKLLSFDEAISCQSPEIATLLAVARNDDYHTPSLSMMTYLCYTIQRMVVASSFSWRNFSLRKS